MPIVVLNDSCNEFEKEFKLFILLTSKCPTVRFSGGSHNSTRPCFCMYQVRHFFPNLSLSRVNIITAFSIINIFLFANNGYNFIFNSLVVITFILVLLITFSFVIFDTLFILTTNIFQCCLFR